MTFNLIRILYRVHKWTGLIVAAPVCCICLTGAICVFEDDIDCWFVPERCVANPRSPSERAGLGEVSAAVSSAFPGAQVTGLEIYRNPKLAITAYAMAGGKSITANADPWAKPVHVSASNGRDTVATLIARIHTRFYIPIWWGRVLVAAFGLTLLVSSITGAVLYSPFLKGVTLLGLRFWQIRPSSTQLAWADWHKLVGITSLAFNLVIGTSGFILGARQLLRYVPALNRPLNPVPRAVKGTQASKIGVDHALEVAKTALPGMEPTLVLFPSTGAPRFTFYARFPGTLMRNAASFVVVDTRTGLVAEAYDARLDRSFVTFYNWMEPLHYGNFGGRIVEWIYFGFGVAGAFLAVSGLAVDRLKRRHGRQTLRGSCR